MTDLASAVQITTAETIRDVVEAAVRGEHEPAIREEIERRVAAVTAAIAGGVEPPPPPRKPRSDKGTHKPRATLIRSDDPPGMLRSPDSRRAQPADDEAGEWPAEGGARAPTPAAPGAESTPETPAGEAASRASEIYRDLVDLDLAHPTPASLAALSAAELEAAARVLGAYPKTDDRAYMRYGMIARELDRRAAMAAPAPAEPAPSYTPHKRRGRKAAPAAHAPDAREPGYTASEPDTSCSIARCLCQRYVSTAKGICGRTGCGHEQGYHSGRPAAATPLLADRIPGEAGDTNLAEQVNVAEADVADPELGF